MAYRHTCSPFPLSAPVCCICKKEVLYFQFLERDLTKLLVSGKEMPIIIIYLRILLGQMSVGNIITIL